MNRFNAFTSSFAHSYSDNVPSFSATCSDGPSVPEPSPTRIFAYPNFDYDAIEPEVAPFGHFPGTQLNRPRLDLQRRDSASTQTSYNETDEAAARATVLQDGFYHSQGNPVRDCAWHTYITQLKRLTHFAFAPGAHLTEQRASWREACASIDIDFFWARLNPPMAADVDASGAAVRALIDAGIIRPSTTEQSQWGLGYVHDYTKKDELYASICDRAQTHAPLEPPLSDYTVIRLNMLKDASTFEYFEIKEIYGFCTPHARELPLPFGLDEIKTTQQACKDRMPRTTFLFTLSSREPTSDMITERQALVRRRKSDMAALIEAQELQELARQANNF